jgi:hypothetical protein
MGRTISFAEGLQREAPGANGSAMLNIGAAVAKGGEGPNMDATLSFLISAGIMAFGVWIVVGTAIAGSPMAWTFAGLVPMVVASISLYQVVSGVKSA